MVREKIYRKQLHKGKTLTKNKTKQYASKLFSSFGAKDIKSHSLDAIIFSSMKVLYEHCTKIETKSTFEVTRAWEGGANGELLLNELSFSLG